MRNVKGNITELILSVEKIKKEIQDRIINLPDNPRINRISKNCFIVNSKDLNNNLAAEYHDFKFTYGIIIKWIEEMDIVNIVYNMEDAISKGWFMHNQVKYRLHPDIVNYLRSIL